MKLRRQRQFAFVITAFLLMFSYQNCAQQNFAIDADTDKTVTYIDDVNSNTGITFHKSSVTVHEEVEVFHIDGECSDKQEGAILSWRLVGDDGVVVKGRSNCENGQFSVQLDDVNQLPCGDMQLVAQLGLEGNSKVDFRRRCLESRSVEVASKNSGICFREFFASEDRCEQACYDQSGGMLGSRALDLNSCQ